MKDFFEQLHLIACAYRWRWFNSRSACRHLLKAAEHGSENCRTIAAMGLAKGGENTKQLLRQPGDLAPEVRRFLNQSFREHMNL